MKIYLGADSNQHKLRIISKNCLFSFFDLGIRKDPMMKKIWELYHEMKIKEKTK